MRFLLLFLSMRWLRCMLRRVHSDCFVSSSVHHSSLFIGVASATIDTSPLRSPVNPPSPPLHPDTLNMVQHPSPTEHPRQRIPNLVNGAPLSADQVGVYRRLADLIDRTLSTGKCQTQSKDEKTLLGAECAAQMPGFFTAECLRRYLVSRHFCEKKAYDMLMHTAHWRQHHVPAVYDHNEFMPCLQSRFMEWLGGDREGRPTLYMKSANANLEIPRNTRLAYMVVTLEKGCSLMEAQFSKHPHVEQWNIVVDESDRGSKHTDNKFLSQVTPMLTSHYAQRLHKCYVINPGWMTSIAFSVLKIFLDEGTTSKIKMVHAKHDKHNRSVRHVSELLAEFGAENVPEAYGGTYCVPLVDDYCRFFCEIPLPKY